MGIKGLTKLLQEKADCSYREQNMKNYFGRKLAIDASMALYQFLVAVRQGGPAGELTNDVGEVTSHIIGFFYRTIRMMENGIKPVWVFDGKPPQFKSEELAKRAEMRAKAEAEKKEAEEEGDMVKVAQMERRLVKVGKKHVEEVQKLLDCMGLPYVKAAGEAEAQCAAMAKAGLVYGTVTEDMDALTFATPRLIRHMTISEARKLPILEFDLEKILSGLDMTMDQFIDMCILCGCDYTQSIRGIGPKKAFDFISKHKNIEGILKTLDKNKYKVPEDFLYTQARGLFKNPEVTDCSTIKLEFTDPNEEALITYMVDEKGFNKDRVLSGLKRLRATKGKASQKRLDSFFKPMPSVSSSKKVSGKKRKEMNSKKSTKGAPAGKKRKVTKK